MDSPSNIFKHNDLLVYDSNGYRVMFIYDEHGLCSPTGIASVRNTNSVFLEKNKFPESDFGRAYCRFPTDDEREKYASLVENHKPKKK